MKQPGLHVIYAAAVRDAAGVNARPGAVLVHKCKVIQAGRPEDLPGDLAKRAKRHDRPDQLLVPAMVNAHAHLELTALGPQPYDPASGFVGWVRELRAERAVPPELRSSPTMGPIPDHRPSGQQVKAFNEFIRRTVLDPISQGGTLSLNHGVQAVGDITSASRHQYERIRPRVAGVVFHELFGIGDDQHLRMHRKFASLLKGLGGKPEDALIHSYQPHAPYSAGPKLYASVAKEAGKWKPVCTHLAETEEEREFVASSVGPWRDYLAEIGKWDDAFGEHYGSGQSPVQWMRPHLEAAAEAGGWLAAHCNYVDDDDIKLLADTNTSVAYCPIASEYFGHRDHRYRDMLAAGVNVCLGTDSIVCALPDDPQPLGLLSAMRRLYQRDQTEPKVLLEMATTRGSRALRLDENVATLKPGAPAYFACIHIDPDDPTEPLEQALRQESPVESVRFENLPAQRKNQ